MEKLSRRAFLVATASTGAVKALPRIASKAPGKRILTLVYDKSLGMMRAIDRVVP